MKIDVCKKKILPQMIIISVGSLFYTILIICFLWFIVKVFTDYGIFFGLLLSSPGWILSILLIFLLIGLIRTVILLIKIYNTSIIFENNCICITHKNREWRIPSEKIKHVFVYNQGTSLVWDIDGAIKTFSLKKSYFTRKAYNEILKFLSNFNGYQEDRKENAKTRKQLGLDDIFRKNRLEKEL